VTKLLRYNSLSLGLAIFMFGFLKLFDPFNTWFHIQIAESGLPPLSIPLGIAGEMSVGVGLLLATAFSARSPVFSRRIIALASAALIVNMAVAIYVHLQPQVPAGVLPLGIKPPFIPAIFMFLAALNLVEIYRSNERVRGFAPTGANGVGRCVPHGDHP
jgi:hypothetical protein